VELSRGFETIRHSDGRLAVTVTASVDPAVGNTNAIRKDLETDLLPALASQHGVSFGFGGRQKDQKETLGDMKVGLVLALSMIYLVLSWVFGSYGWPLILMFIIPFAAVGAIWGHVALGIDLTLLSLFGLFGLSGIVVNDSIILVVFYRDLRIKGMQAREAVIEAACQRLWLDPALVRDISTGAVLDSNGDQYGVWSGVCHPACVVPGAISAADLRKCSGKIPV